MAFFAPRSSASFYEPNYSGLFRLIDEFNNYAAESANGDVAAPSPTAAAGPTGANKRRSVREPLAIWTPKFDLHETPNTYVLHGEFPGLDKKDINIEFTDDQTLTIRGRSERSHTHTSDDEDDVVMVDKDKEQQAKEGQQPAKDKEAGSKEVAHKDKSKQQVGAHHQPKYKYWVSERSFGEFARTFTFPARVDASGVVAKLDNGVLNLVVPKAHKAQGRKITVQ